MRFTKRYQGLALSLTAAVLLTGCQSLHKGTESSDAELAMESLSATKNANSLRQSADNIDLSDETVQQVFSNAKALVESYFDISLDQVSLSIVANSVIEDEVERETRALILPQFSNRNYAELFLSKIMSDQAGTYAALYANKGTRVLVNRPLLLTFLQSIKQPGKTTRAELAEQALTALLIHEAVHAADDQMHQIHDRRELNFRASFSQSAAYEGHAQLVTREICKTANCTAGLAELDNFMFDAPEPTDPMARSMQAVSRNVLEYSYIEGERFLKSLADRSDGKELLQKVLRSPPADPVQILDPGNYPDNDRIETNRNMFKTLQGIDHPWNQAPWAMIETSPIKGLDMRDNPARRKATVDGFTRLITAMISAQVYNQAGESVRPVEISLIETESTDTAIALAETFQKQALASPGTRTDTAAAPHDGTRGNRLDMMIGADDQQWPMSVYLTNVKFETAEKNEENYSTVIATSGQWIIQLAGSADPRDTDMIAFAEKSITELQEQNANTTSVQIAPSLKSRLAGLLGFGSTLK